MSFKSTECFESPDLSLTYGCDTFWRDGKGNFYVWEWTVPGGKTTWIEGPDATSLAIYLRKCDDLWRKMKTFG